MAVIQGTNGNDPFLQGSDPFAGDTVYGLAGDDQLWGDAHAPTPPAASKPDRADSLYGGSGNDTFHVNYFTTQYSFNGQDLTSWWIDEAIENANEGIDTVVLEGNLVSRYYALPNNVENLSVISDVSFNSGTFLLGNSLDNVISGSVGGDKLYGLAGADTVAGGSGDDLIFGDAGNDYLIGGDGNDQVFGGVDDDTLLGEQGADYLDGGSGNDLLSAGGDDDTALGGLGDDYIILGSGNDLGFGGGGRDSLIGEDGDDYLNGEDGDDTVYGNAGQDTLLGGNGKDYLNGEDGNDLIIGSADDDIVIGGAGDDYLDGGAGNDILAGNDGNDTLFASSGNDYLEGGAGNDVFVFEGNFGHSLVIDLQTGAGSGDVIQFKGGVFDDFADLMAHTHQDATNVVITADTGDTLTLANVALANLVALDFSFG